MGNLHRMAAEQITQGVAARDRQQVIDSSLRTNSVEYAIESQCGLAGLTLHVTEQRWREKCGPIALD
jgi:hypothetical protein